MGKTLPCNLNITILYFDWYCRQPLNFVNLYMLKSLSDGLISLSYNRFPCYSWNLQYCLVLSGVQINIASDISRQTVLTEYSTYTSNLANRNCENLYLNPMQLLNQHRINYSQNFVDTKDISPRKVLNQIKEVLSELQSQEVCHNLNYFLPPFPSFST